MSRVRFIAALLSLMLVSAGLSAVASAASPASAAATRPFTLRGARFIVRAHRLTYEVTICTPAKSVLSLRAKFVPTKRARGLITLTPGTTQYQDHGCWPAFVSAAIARKETMHCKPLDCPAIAGHRYRSTVTVVITKPHESRRAPRLRATA